MSDYDTGCNGELPVEQPSSKQVLAEIVRQLEARGAAQATGEPGDQLCKEAADEITRLALKVTALKHDSSKDIDRMERAASALERMTAIARGLREENDELRKQLSERLQQIELTRTNIEGVLDALGTNAIRVREGGGAEDILASLALSFAKLEQCHREGWLYAKEVEDEYRRRTGRGFGDPEPPNGDLTEAEQLLHAWASLLPPDGKLYFQHVEKARAYFQRRGASHSYDASGSPVDPFANAPLTGPGSRLEADLVKIRAAGEKSEKPDAVTAFENVAAAAGDTWNGVDAVEYTNKVRAVETDGHLEDDAMHQRAPGSHTAVRVGKAVKTIPALLDWLNEECCALQPIAGPIADTGDHDLHWEVIRYQMAKPCEVVIGAGRSAADAIVDAMKDADDPTRWNYVPPEHRDAP